MYETGTLKQTRRTSWWMTGARDPENGAEHSWHTASTATINAKPEGPGPTRPAYLTVRHDTQESRAGSVNHLGVGYVPAGAPPPRARTSGRGARNSALEPLASGPGFRDPGPELRGGVGPSFGVREGAPVPKLGFRGSGVGLRAPRSERLL
ncbi:HD domain-containing protein [Streptomyces sp. DH8]|uniref:HD domain-containing protein n=1 Tax=Streptomyces sp. DH8 TaxID=2857008 RepID=UPI0035AF52D2